MIFHQNFGWEIIAFIAFAYDLPTISGHSEWLRKQNDANFWLQDTYGVWMCTMDNHRLGPTARRCARTLGLGGAPESTVGDVPTAYGASRDRESVVSGVLWESRELPPGGSGRCGAGFRRGESIEGPVVTRFPGVRCR